MVLAYILIIKNIMVRNKYDTLSKNLKNSVCASYITHDNTQKS